MTQILRPRASPEPQHCDPGCPLPRCTRPRVTGALVLPSNMATTTRGSSSCKATSVQTGTA